MRKIISAALAMCLIGAALFGIIPCVYGAGSAHMSLVSSSATVFRGDSFSLKVNLANDQPLNSGGVMLSYDSNIFEFVGGSCNVSNVTLSEVSASRGGGVFVLQADAVVSGTIFIIQMRVKENAPFGAYSISGKASLSISCGFGGTSVTVACRHTYGNAVKTDDNSHIRTCTICGEQTSQAHTWDGGTVLENATCQKAGSQRRKCTACGATKIETISRKAHTYQDAVYVDAQNHRKVCKNCNYALVQAHDYGEEWEHDENSHFHSCEGCGHRTGQAAHVPGPKATETEDQVCTVCNRVLKSKGTHVHTFEETWSGDETSHWHVCSDCQEKANIFLHEYTDACDATCDVCGASREPVHAPGSKWLSDKTGHWRECTLCNQRVGFAAHVPGAEATITSAQLCTTCGFELAPALPHGHSFDNAVHSHFCECGERYEAEQGECPICKPFRWWIVCVAEAVVFAGVIAGGYVWLKKKGRIK